MSQIFIDKPWFSSPVKLSPNPVGMLGLYESSLYYYLAKDIYSGSGVIIDSGSFLGRSAFFLGHGLLQNFNVHSKYKKIHCFDNFIVNPGDQTTIDYIQQYLNINLSFGNSTRFIFDQQTQIISEVLTVHQYDFEVFTWNKENVEILIVDVAKNVSLGSAVLRNFFPSLMPNISLVIHQDYHHPWLPHIPIVMEYLAPYFQIVVPRVNDSIVFKYIEKINDADYNKVLSFNFTPSEQLDLINSAIQRLAHGDRIFVELSRIVLLLKNNSLGLSPKAEFLKIKEKYGSDFVGLEKRYIDDVERVL